MGLLGVQYTIPRVHRNRVICVWRVDGFLVCPSFLKMKRTVGLRVPLNAFTGRGYWSICPSATSWWKKRCGNLVLLHYSDCYGFALFGYLL